jgi:hypothetical protein
MVGISEMGEGEAERCRKVNMVQILCTHANGKVTPVGSILGMGGVGDKGEWWKG